MAAVRKVLEEEHDLIMLGANSIDDGLANMAKRVNDLLSK
jgi:multiple sugar transport system substrate-binding protein